MTKKDDIIKKIKGMKPRVKVETPPPESDTPSERQERPDSEQKDGLKGQDRLSIPMADVAPPVPPSLEDEKEYPKPKVADELAPLLPGILIEAYRFGGKILKEEDAKSLASTLMSCPAIGDALDGLEVFQGPEGCLALFGAKAAILYLTSEPVPEEERVTFGPFLKSIKDAKDPDQSFEDPFMNPGRDPYA